MCSGMRLKKQGFLSELKLNHKYNGIVLSPDAKFCISIEDKDIISEYGVCVIDCSWAKFKELNISNEKYNCRSRKIYFNSLKICKSTFYGCC